MNSITVASRCSHRPVKRVVGGLAAVLTLAVLWRVRLANLGRCAVRRVSARS